MTQRTRTSTVVFNHPFLLKGVDRVLPPGPYRVVTDEELLEGLSFAAYRRVSTMIFVPAHSHQASSVEMLVIDPANLEVAQQRDAAMQGPTATIVEAVAGPNPSPRLVFERECTGLSHDRSNHRA